MGTGKKVKLLQLYLARCRYQSPSCPHLSKVTLLHYRTSILSSMSRIASLSKQSRIFVRSLVTPTTTLTTSTPSSPPRKIWTKNEIQSVYDSSLLDLVFRAASVHRMHHDPNKIQLCTLMNIKSRHIGSCTSDDVLTTYFDSRRM